MPDKHEVGGSSPLGPTKASHLRFNRAKMQSSFARYKHIKEEWFVKRQSCLQDCSQLPERVGDVLIENRIKKRNETDSCN